MGGFTITFVHKMLFKNWDLHVRYCKIDMKTSVNQINRDPEVHKVAIEEGSSFGKLIYKCTDTCIYNVH